MAHHRWFVTLCALVCCLGCSGPGNDDQGELKKVQLQLNWYPEAEHGGFYAAQLHGYYAEEGFDVEIIAGGPGASVIQKAATGKVEFAVANADQVVIGRHQQADVVALMAPLQDSPRSIMVHAHSDVKRFEDLKGRTVAMGSGKAYAQFMAKKGLLEGVEIVKYSGSVARFLEDEQFAQQAYVFSEPFLAEQQGAATRNLMVSSLGFNPYTSVLITSDEQLASDRAMVEAIVRASVRGWQRYLADSAMVNRHIHSLNENMSMEILDFGVEQLRPLCVPAGMEMSELGQMKHERWELLANQLEEIGMLDKPVDPSRCFDSGGLK